MNMKLKRCISLLLSMVMVVTSMSIMYTEQAFAADTTVYIVGDSTACHYADSADATYYYKRVGFGDKLENYLTGATVSNLALSGRSSKSFATEKNYTTLMNSVTSGDIVLIAFGHNDEKADNTDVYTEPLGDKDKENSFKHSLYTNYIVPIQEKGATPILCSPIVRLPKSTSFSDSEIHIANGKSYAVCVQELAEEVGVGFIDLTSLTKAKYEESLTYAANYHARPTKDTIDRTHLNNYGANMVASLIANNAEGTALAYYINSEATQPSESDMVVNPDYKEASTDDLTGDDLTSEIWTTTDPWYGSVFGAVGGTPKKGDNFDIAENTDGSVNIKCVGGKGKMSSSADGIAFYYQPVPANENFKVSATVHINTLATDNNQISFGALMADKILVDTKDSTFSMNSYVAAGPINLYKATTGGSANATFAKTTSTTTVEETDDDGNVTTTETTSGTITKGPKITTAIPAEGDDINVSIIKYGNVYKAQFGDYSAIYTLTDEQMSGMMYAGFYAARNADVTFSDITYYNEIVESDMGEDFTSEEETESTTEAVYDESIANSFTFWGEDVANVSDGKLYSATYGANGSQIIISRKTALSPYSKGNYTDADGNTHLAYKIEKYTTNSGYVAVKPAADGWVTFYMYTADKSMYISTTGPGKDNSESTSTANPLTIPVTKGTTYYISSDGTSNFSFAGVSFKMKEEAAITGNVTVNSESDNTVADGSKVVFTNTETGDVSYGEIAADGTYTASVSKGFTYSVSFEGTDTLVLDSEDIIVEVTDDTATCDITLVDANAEATPITVYGPANTDVTVAINDDDYTITTDENGVGSTTLNLTPGTYTVAPQAIEDWDLSSLSSNSFTVKHNGSENYKNILYTQAVTPATGYDIYVDQTGNYYSGKDNLYTNLTDAMAAIDSSSLKSSSSQRFVVHVAPGTYEEQFFVKTNYVSIIKDSEFNDDVIITWYYGIDYKYYSIDPATGYYDKAYAYDKHTKTTCTQSWGSAVIVKGSNFYTEGITYQNTFNIELRDAELADGVECDLTNDDTNTSYDRTQAGADVKLTTATERAAALVINGNNGEFYNCKFYGSQDTLMTGSGSHYFKDCLIAGETDYIFGDAGGTTYFDDCELMWIDYHYAGTTTKEKPGYIAVPRGSYVFRNCNITSSGLGQNVTTGDAVTTEGYYGRPWGTGANVIFMNCQTNDLILAAGWNSMSGVTPDSVYFREYENYAADGTTFYSTLTETALPDGSARILTAEEAAENAAEYDWKVFGTWKPVNHVAYVGNPNIFKFDFTKADPITSIITDETGVAELSQTGFKYHGSSYGIYSGNGGSMTVYAGADADEMTIYVDSSYIENNGTLYLYKNDEEEAVDSIEFANSANHEILAFTLADVKAGDTYTITYAGSKSFYCGYLSAESTDGTLTTAPVTNNYEFDFKSVSDVSSGKMLDTNGVAEISYNNKINLYTYGFDIKNEGEISFTLAEEGKTTIIVPSSYKDNDATITLYNSTGEEIYVLTLTGVVDGTIKAELAADTYTIKYVMNNDINDFYTSGLTIDTAGKLAEPEVKVTTNTYKYDFAAASDGHAQNDIVTGTLYDTNNLAPITFGSNIKYHSTNYGFMISNGATLTFDSITAGNSTITVNSSYSTNSGKVTLLDSAGNEIASTDTMTGATEATITADLNDNTTYTLRYDVTGTFYTKGFSVETTGELGTIAQIPTNTYTYDFAAASDGHAQDDIVTGTLYDTNNLAPITFGSNIKYHSTSYGFMISNGATLTFDSITAGNSTITVNSSYSTNSGKVTLLDSAGNEIASTDTMTGATEATITADLNDNTTYTLRYDVTGTFYTKGFSVETTGELGIIAQTPTNTYTYDFAASSDGHAQGDIVAGTLYDTNNLAPITFGSNIKYHSTNYGFMISNGATLTFDSITAGNSTITVNSSYSSNSGKVTLLDSAGNEIASTDTMTGATEATITADLNDNTTYTLRYDVTGSFYTKGFSVETTGELGTIAQIPTNTYTYSFLEAGSTIQNTTAEQSAEEDANAVITLDATNNGKFGYKDTTYGYQISTGSAINFTLAGDGDLTTTVTLKSSYCAADSVINIVNTDTDETVGTINIANGSKADESVTFTGAAGNYSIVFTDSSNQYVSSLTITTTGTVTKPAEEIQPTVYTYDFRTATELGYVYDNNKTAPVKAEGTDSVKYHGTTHGLSIYNGGEIGLYLENGGDTTFTINISYCVGAEGGTIALCKGDEIVAESETITSTGDVIITASDLAAGAYTLRYNISTEKPLYTPTIAISTYGTISENYTITDAVNALKNNGTASSTDNLLYFDFDKDGTIDKADTANILRKAAGL